MGAALNVGNVTVANNVTVTFASVGSTFATSGSVRTIDVGSGATLDFSSQAISTAAGTGFIKTGPGVLALAGGTYPGGFTLNDGAVVARGTTALGSGTGNSLALNGGTLTANASRSFDNTRFPAGITVGGNVQLGAFPAAVTLSLGTAGISLANNVSLGGGRRTLTIGNTGTHVMSGVISNGSLTFASVPGAEATASGAGRFDVTNTANTFTGDIEINGPEVRFTADGSLGNAANNVLIDGGRFGKASDATTVTLASGRRVFVGDAVGTAVSSPGAGTLVINVGIQDKPGETGSWLKQGGGTLELGGASSYTGGTGINNGIVRLTTGTNRLPVTTVLSLGQSLSANLGTLDLNGFNQVIAGLNSVSGTNAAATKNTISSTLAATLTVNGAGTYGDGTAGNSGVLTGAISLVKSGIGTLTLGDTNTYTGTTVVSGGTLALGMLGSIASSSAVSVNAGAFFDVSAKSGFALGTGQRLGGKGTVLGSLEFGSGSQFAFDPTGPLLVGSGTVSFAAGFGIGSIFGLDATVAEGTYTLLNETTGGSISFANLANVGPGSPFDLGGGKAAYFQQGSLQVVVVPEPDTFFIGGLGLALAGLATCRHRRRRSCPAA
jgi:autotransporter-associated beta strand protein